MLWKPGTGADETLSPGMQDNGVKWLRESLASLRGEPLVEPNSELYDQALAARVREYQRDHRLTVEGIVGTQTQIVMNTELAIPGTPILVEAP